MDCVALVRYERWAVEDPTLDCAIFICDLMDYRTMLARDEREEEGNEQEKG